MVAAAAAGVAAVAPLVLVSPHQAVDQIGTGLLHVGISGNNL